MCPLEQLKWPRVKFEHASGLTRWRVEPAMAGAPCLNFGVEFSRETAETKAGNYVRLLFGEDFPTFQEILQ